MAIQGTTGKNAAASGYASKALYVTLSSTTPGSSPGTETSGITRVAASWSAPSAGLITMVTPIPFPAGATVAGVMYYDAITGGNYVDGFSVTSTTYGSAGTATVTSSEQF